jgi:hypothetical protein
LPEETINTAKFTFFGGVMVQLDSLLRYDKKWQFFCELAVNESVKILEPLPIVHVTIYLYIFGIPARGVNN